MKSSLRSFFIFSLMGLFFALQGCSSDSGKKIGFLYPSNSIKRYNKESNFFKNFISSKGVDVIVRSADNDESIQIEQAKELIGEGIDALVITAVNVNTAAAIVREAKDHDVPVLAYNRMIENCELDFFVASKNDLIGKIMVDAVMKEKPAGNFVILGGDMFDKNGEGLYTAVKKYLKPYIDNGKVKIVYETYIEQWSAEVAGFEMEKVISLYGKDIDAVIAGFDGMAEAVIDVLKKYELEGKVAVTGQDAEIRGCKNVIKGYQCVTVFHPLKTIAEKAAEIALALSNGENINGFVNSTEKNGLIEVPTHRVNSIGITKDNIDKELIESGFYKHEELY